MNKLRLCLCGIVMWMGANAQLSQQPNFIFIFADDLIELTDAFGPGSQAIAPNLQRLRNMGVSFTRANCNATVCAPSRASVFTGMLPSTTGYFGYRSGQVPWLANPVLNGADNLFLHFKKHGYQVHATGKAFHAGVNRLSDFTTLVITNRGPEVWDGVTVNNSGRPIFSTHPGLPVPVAEAQDGGSGSFSTLEDHPGYVWAFRDGAIYNPSDPTAPAIQEEQITNFGINVLNQEQASPFLLYLGYYSPHSPYYAPDKYFDKFPIGTIQEIATLCDFDLLPVAMEKNRWNRNDNLTGYQNLIGESQQHAVSNYWVKHLIQGYLALVALLDDQLGTVIDALEASPYKDNTYIILSSDHGFHLGERCYIKKTTLWNPATSVPLVIAGPGLQVGQSVAQPVSLVDVFPTMLELANLPAPTTHPLDGASLVPLCTGQPAQYTGPPHVLVAVASNERLMPLSAPGNPNHQHYSIFDGEFRYNSYSSGEEQLFRSEADPEELLDLARTPEYQYKLAEMRAILNNHYGIQTVVANPWDALYYKDFSQDMNGWLIEPGSPPNSGAIEVLEEPYGKAAKLTLLPSLSLAVANGLLALNSNRTYRLSFDVKGNGYTGQVRAQIRTDFEENTAGELISEFLAPVSNNWTRHSFEFNAGDVPNRFSRKLVFRFTQAGELWIDNVTVEDIAVKNELLHKALSAPVITPQPLLYSGGVSRSFEPHFEFATPCTPAKPLLARPQAWYRFTAPARELNLWSTTTGVNVSMALYSDPLSPPILCSDDSAETIGQALLVAKGLTIGQEYYVLVTYPPSSVSGLGIQVTTGVTFAPTTALVPLQCNAGSFGAVSTLAFTPLPSYTNLQQWEAIAVRVSNPADTLRVLLPPNVPPVFSANLPQAAFTPGAAYEVRVRNRMYNGPIWSNYGKACTLTYQPPVQSARIGLYPNPGNGDIIYVQRETDPGLEPVRAELFDMPGRLIWSQQISSEQVPLVISPRQASLADGIYTLKLVYPNGHTEAGVYILKN